jgi:hypothetical protein
MDLLSKIGSSISRGASKTVNYLIGDVLGANNLSMIKAPAKYAFKKVTGGEKKKN